MTKVESYCERKNIAYQIKQLTLGTEVLEVKKIHAYLFQKKNNVVVDYRGFHSEVVWIYQKEDYENMKELEKNIRTLNNMFFIQRRTLCDSKAAAKKVLEYALENNMMLAYDAIYN